MSGHTGAGPYTDRQSNQANLPEGVAKISKSLKPGDRVREVINTSPKTLETRNAW